MGWRGGRGYGRGSHLGVKLAGDLPQDATAGQTSLQRVRQLRLGEEGVQHLHGGDRWRRSGVRGRGSAGRGPVRTTLLTSCLMVSFGRALMADSSVSSQALLTTEETTNQHPAPSQSRPSGKSVSFQHPSNKQPAPNPSASNCHPASNQSVHLPVYLLPSQSASSQAASSQSAAAAAAAGALPVSLWCRCSSTVFRMQ